MKMQKTLYKYIPECIILVGAAVFYVLFCNSFMTELPHLSWFDFFHLIEPYYNGTLNFKDLLQPYSEHGMLGYNLIFLFNLKFFHLSTMFDVYLNDLNVFLCGCIISIYYVKTVVKRDWKYFLGFILICFYMFSASQISSGAMETQVRLGCLWILISFIWINKIFHEKNSNKNIIITIVLLIISLNIFGTIYTFAGIPCVFILGVLYMIKRRDKRKEAGILCITCVLLSILYLVEYNLLNGIFSGTGNGNGIIEQIFALIFHPLNLIKSIIAYNGGAALGSAFYMSGSIDDNIYLIAGIIVTCLIVYALVRYVKSNFYKKTYVPLFLISYSFVVAILTVIGRGQQGWDWLLSEWYNIHSKFQIIGCIWILAYDLNIKIQKRKYRVYVNIGNLAVLLLFSIIANVSHLNRAPAVAQYYKDKQQYYFMDIEDIPVDENGNTPLLADVETTKNAIELLRKYHLSIYYYLS